MLSLVDLRTRIASGALSPEGAIRLAQEAIAEREPAIGALVCRHEVPVVATQGPLAGIAIGVKDIIDTADLPTQMGSPVYAGWRPKADAAIVTRLRALGAVPLAKTTTSPFASLDPTATHNPHAAGHTPGGSSAGSAAAVGAGMVPLALGTQTGGSIIRPAAFCGVAAIKPSFRLLPLVGVKTFSWALDTLGLFGAGIRDVAHALALLADRPAIDLSGDAPTAPRIGLVLQDFAGAADPDAIEALHAARRAAERAGAIVTDLTLPEPLAEAWRCHQTVQNFEARQSLAWEYAHHREALTPILGAALDEAQAITAEAYDAARRQAHRARRVLKDVFSEQDALLTFSAPGRAPAGLGATGDPRFNRLWTLMGVPCVNLPVPGEGLPLGVQVITRFGDDGRALAVAAMIEGIGAVGSLPDRFRREFVSPMMSLMGRSDAITYLQANAEAVRAMGATSLYLFGSTVRDEAEAGSDLDVFVEYDPESRFNAFDLIGIKLFLEDRLGTAVDVTTRDSLHPRLRDRIERSALRVF